MPLAPQLAIALLISTNVDPGPDRTTSKGLSFQPRARAVLMVVTPKGTATGLASATLFDAASAELERSTDLELVSTERAGVDGEALRACPADQPLGCWVNSLSGRPSTDDRIDPRVLLVVSLYPIEQGQQVLHVSLIDLGQALRSYVQLRDQGGDDWRERAEDAIYAGAVHAEPVQLSELGVEPLRAYFAERLGGDFRPLLEAGGHFARFGRLVVDNTPDGLEITIDGHVAGQSQTPATEIVDVPVGAREVSLKSIDGSTMRATTSIDAGTTTHLQYLPPPPPASTFRRVTFWTAIGLGAVGAGLSIVAAAQAGANVRSGCVVPAGSDPNACPNPGFPTPGFDPNPAPSTNFDALNPSGPSTAALGASLLGAGAVTATSILLFGEKDQAPWAQIAAGVAVGLGTFVVVSVIDPREAQP